ncbi:ArsR/SmtB family transcription factor [Rhizobacter sp. LjRoot28]|uniref:ArsR/SmtB family transcription factor n=1 Tax=Rhizobacter sp. LjRoot28 TaxID=3342309 RepID=UPI003ECC5B05
MVERNELDLVFAALADPTRREVLQTLESGSRSVGELAQPHAMSLPGFMKHLSVLEAAGLISRVKEGRVVRCELTAEPMRGAQGWLSRYEAFWNDRLDALGRYLYHQEEITPCPTPPAPKRPGSSSAATTRSAPTRSGARGRTRRR